MLFVRALRGASGAVLWIGTPFLLGVRVTNEQRLSHLGWKLLGEGQHEDGRWCVLAKSCGQFILAFAKSYPEAWSALFSIAMKLTMSAPAPTSATCPGRAESGGRRFSYKSRGDSRLPRH